MTGRNSATVPQKMDGQGKGHFFNGTIGKTIQNIHGGR